MDYFEECITRRIAAARERARIGGWEFEERDAARHFTGDFVGAVLAIESPQDARRFYEGFVARIQRQIDTGIWQSDSTAEEGARADIGWCFGEGMSAERIAMWNTVCGAAHPVFGAGLPTFGEACAAELAKSAAVD